MKTVTDAVNEFKGEYPYDEPSIIEQISTGNFDSWREECDHGLNTGNFRLVCTTNEFNKCVEEMTNMNIKPVYSQAMVDAGVMPSVGMECQTSTGIVTVRYVGKSVVVADDDEGSEFTMSKKGALHSLKPLTPPIELIDGKAYNFITLGTEVNGIYRASDDSFYDHYDNYPFSTCTNIQLLEVK